MGVFMNFRKLITYLTMGTAAAMPLAVAQNPTILQGNYITNVFGNSNFVLNPNALTNVANVTNATRSTTTPLVATSEFTLSLASGANATWTLRAFDGGMKGQNCEARFTYRGFATATTKAEIVQNSLVVASLTLTPTTDPRIASINFPCGDLVNATTFRIAQTTANMTGTNEIGGIYVGLATNMANVAQAEFVGSLTWPNTSAVSSVVNQTSFTAFPNLGTTPTATGNVTASGTAPKVTITNMKPGSYQIIFTGNAFCFSTLVDISCNYRITDGTTAFGQEIGQRTIAGLSPSIQGQTQTTFVFSFDYSGPVTSKTFQLEARLSHGTGETRIETAAAYGNYKVAVYRFPSSSELVVTPERQNWYVSAVLTGGLPNLGTVTTSLSEITNSTLNLTPESGSQPVATLCSGTNAPPTPSTSTTTCAAGDESVGITFTPPSVGSYEVCAEFSSSITTGAGGNADVTFQIQETATNNNVALTNFSGSANAGFSVPNTTYNNQPVNICQIVQISSIGQKAFRLFRYTGITGTVTSNVIIANDSQGKRNLRWKVTPVTNQSNSALYVQGPVKAAATGAAIPAGYVGTLRSFRSTGCGTNAAYNGGAGISLPVGVWRVQGTASLEGGGTITDFLGIIGPAPASTVWRQSFWNDSWWSAITVPKLPIVLTPFYVRYDGTNLYYFDNGSWGGATASATGAIYMNFFRNSSACAQVYTQIQAEQIN